MASNVVSIPLAGSLSLVAGASFCGHKAVAQRVSSSTIASPVLRQANPSRFLAVRCAAESEQTTTLTGVVFEPFREVESLQLSQSPQDSLARQRFQVSVESAINDQINVEYNNCYIYHALFAYFDRDNIALPGLAKFFKDSSEEEREHAEKFMVYQNQRGGRVKLLSVLQPPMDFGNAEKGDALYAMELALCLEKLTTEKLYALHKVAKEANDVHLSHLVEGEYLEEQIQSIKKISEYVAQLRRIGNDGHGVVYWDRILLGEGA